MSSLPEISAELATYFSLATQSLGAALVGSAAQRIADGSIEAGQGCFRRLFRRGGGEDGTLVELPEGRSEERADQLLGALSTEDRQRLAEALMAWIDEQRDRTPDAARLAELIAAKAHTHTYNVTAQGANSAAIGSVGAGATFNFGSGRDGGGA
ncbi:DUF1552 domain-containing protein [Streptomyces sp. NBC_01005]|uniref:hypothetical protein n=1 Tax=unclassified Streptomyces TaxID=2593676 RepID=UPI003866DD62|nr:DUF1552 domain-containing protein [Streptomyces sp. NBC_01005]WTC96757.1 DUF1552 domain-containing protein [Streptomyces sp. NBC_01650]